MEILGSIYYYFLDPVDSCNRSLFGPWHFYVIMIDSLHSMDNIRPEAINVGSKRPAKNHFDERLIFCRDIY